MGIAEKVRRQEPLRVTFVRQYHPSYVSQDTLWSSIDFLRYRCRENSK